jgi:hypothetical protein
MTAPTAWPLCTCCRRRPMASGGWGGRCDECLGQPPHTHDDISRLDLTEVRLSDCEFGCKIWRCNGCGEEMLLHSATYGCPGGAA